MSYYACKVCKRAVVSAIIVSVCDATYQVSLGQDEFNESIKYSTNNGSMFVL